jgi:group I intron endonuclease
MKISGIYKIQSIKKPNRCYIGSAVNITKRWGHHLQELRINKHGNKKLQNHFNKYGESDFQFSVLVGCDKVDLIKTEQYFIDSYKSWFNICPTAGSQLGVKRSEESCKRIGEAHKGRIPWNKGIKATEQAKQNQSKSHIGQKVWNKGKKNIYSEETLLKLRASLKGRKVWNKGKHYHFHNERDNSVYKGKIFSEETKLKLKIAQANRPPISAETREKMRINSMGNKNMLGKPVSKETKQKISEGLKRYFAEKKEFDIITNN